MWVTTPGRASNTVCGPGAPALAGNARPSPASGCAPLPGPQSQGRRDLHPDEGGLLVGSVRRCVVEPAGRGFVCVCTCV